MVDAGLGERKVFIPNIRCSDTEFRKILIEAFPKLEGCGGFELMRCIPNSKELTPIPISTAQSPMMLKATIGNGRVFVRPIQKNLSLEPVKGKNHAFEVCFHANHHLHHTLKAKMASPPS